MPPANEDEIKHFFFTFLVTLNPENEKSNPIVALENHQAEGFWLLELSTQDNLEILINIDHTEWRGCHMRVSSIIIFNNI